MSASNRLNFFHGCIRGRHRRYPQHVNVKESEFSRWRDPHGEPLTYLKSGETGKTLLDCFLFHGNLDVDEGFKGLTLIEGGGAMVVGVEIKQVRDCL
jgi:hypothetical protein